MPAYFGNNPDNPLCYTEIKGKELDEAIFLQQMGLSAFEILRFFHAES